MRALLGLPIIAVLLTVMTLPFHAFLGVTIMGQKTLLGGSHYPDLHNGPMGAWLPDPYSDQNLAGGILWAAGDLVGLAFFLLLTEMHERYAFPVLAVLPIWALGSAWRERAYLLLSAAMLLNLTVVQPVKEIAGEISGLHLVVFGLFVGALLLPFAGASRSRTPGGEDRLADSPPAPPASALVAWFRRVTLACLDAARWRPVRMPHALASLLETH